MSYRGSRNNRVSVGLVACLFAAAGCSSSTTAGSPEASPASTSSASVDDESMTANSSAPAATTIEVVVQSYLPGNVILAMADDDMRGDGSCAIAVGEALSRGNSVELSFEGLGSPLTTKLEPSPTNGDEIPCVLEARFAGVPGESTDYTAKIIGGESAGIYEVTVTNAQLKSDGYEIEVIPKVDPTEGLVAAVQSAYCLQGKVSYFKVQKNYSQYSGKGRGDDIFVENRVTFKNNCDKAIKGIEYVVTFEDEFGDSLQGCRAKIRTSLSPGRSMQTAGNRGCTINQYDDDFSSWESAGRGDISRSVDVERIVFKDGTKIDASL